MVVVVVGETVVGRGDLIIGLYVVRVLSLWYRVGGFQTSLDTGFLPSSLGWGRGYLLLTPFRMGFRCGFRFGWPLGDLSLYLGWIWPRGAVAAACRGLLLSFFLPDNGLCHLDPTTQHLQTEIDLLVDWLMVGGSLTVTVLPVLPCRFQR
jgi:hypothetical protein